MTHDPHDTGTSNQNGADSQNDRAILDYLEEILREPAVEPTGKTSSVTEKAVTDALTRAPQTVSDNIAAFDLNRSRKPEPPPARVKTESRQPVTLPFRSAEKNRVLTSPSLLNLSPAPAQDEPAVSAADPVQTAAIEDVAINESIPATESVAAQPHPEAAEHARLQPDAIEKPVEPAGAESSVESLDLGTESVAAAALLPEVKEWHDNGRPAWAQHRFDCLIFSVAGLKLAVPLITLGAIHRIERKFNALPHQSNWFIGILQTQSAGNIKVLDTALCVMPERYDPASRDKLEYVLTIHGYPWGLACHQVHQSISLDPDKVKWRGQRGKRPWLAGTVIDHMCALIDTDGFRDLILNAERPR